MQDFINGRCGWCGTDELYVKYHDEEWGKPVTDDKTLFEFLVLESAQAGLSWITILKKREGYRKAFCNFDATQVAQMTNEDVERLMHFDGIVKNRLKIKSTITNAKLFLAIQKEFGSFYNYTTTTISIRRWRCRCRAGMSNAISSTTATTSAASSAAGSSISGSEAGSPAGSNFICAAGRAIRWSTSMWMCRCNGPFRT